MRLRYRLTTWLLGSCNGGELVDAVAAVGSRLNERDRAHAAHRLADSLGAKERACMVGVLLSHLDNDGIRAVWHNLGLLLNVEKDGRLDLGRSKEGN